MSSHKPRTYRSIKGCCVCRVKSSTSRFTNSSKYEEHFEGCFLMKEKRSGEICNACVLLVKRWKKLPPGEDKNWSYVVDARLRPGTRSILKKKKKALGTKIKPDSKERNLDITMKDGSLNISSPSSNISEKKNCVHDSDCSDCENGSMKKRKHTFKRKRPRNIGNAFIDQSYWTQIYSCCGPYYCGRSGEVLIDMKQMHWCKNNQNSGFPQHQFRRSHSTDTDSCSTTSSVMSGQLAEDSTATLGNPSHSTDIDSCSTTSSTSTQIITDPTRGSYSNMDDKPFEL